MLTTDSCRRLEERLRRPLLCCLLLRVRVAARDLPQRHRCARSTRLHTCRAAALARQHHVRTRKRTRRRRQQIARARTARGSQPARLAGHPRPRNDLRHRCAGNPSCSCWVGRKFCPATTCERPPIRPDFPLARPPARPLAHPARPPARPRTVGSPRFPSRDLATIPFPGVSGNCEHKSYKRFSVI